MIDLNTCSTEAALNALKNGKIKFKLNGHFMNMGYENRNNNWKIDDLKKKFDEHLSISIKFYNLPANLIIHEIRDTCNCGEILRFSILDNNTVGYKETCPYEKEYPIQTTEIEIPTGELIICNFIVEKLIEDNKEKTEILHQPKDQYSKKFSISQLSGRINMAEHYAKHNLGYGQMGNMSVGVFVNPDKNKIIIGDAYAEDYEDYDCKPNPDWQAAMKQNYKLIDNISLSMWRWMCIDKSFIPENTRIEEQLTVTVIPGKYKIIHYYDTAIDYDDMQIFKYSTLEKIQNCTKGDI